MWRLRGHEPLLRQVDKSFKGGRHSHAYLLVGPAQVGKGALAINMAQAMNCLSPEDAPCGECIQCRHIVSGQHADVLVIGVQRPGEDGPPRREIGIGDVRDVQRQASLKPYEGRCRVYIFDGAEYLSEEASNALLKTLEEPPPQVMLILLTPHEELLLPTIRSRCRRLELRPLPRAEMVKELVNAHSIGTEEAEKLACLSMGCLGWALSAIKDPAVLEKRREELDRIAKIAVAGLEDRFSYASDLATLFFRNREEAREVLRLWLRWWRDLLIIKEGAEEFVYNVDWIDTLRLRASECTTVQVVGFIRGLLSTLEALEHNANPRLALEMLMLMLSLQGERTG